MDATMYAAFVQVARAKHVEPHFYGQLQQASRGAMVPPDLRLERVHRGIQLPLGLGWKIHYLLNPPPPLIHMVTILMGKPTASSNPCRTSHASQTFARNYSGCSRKSTTALARQLDSRTPSSRGGTRRAPKKIWRRSWRRKYHSGWGGKQRGSPHLYTPVFEHLYVSFQSFLKTVFKISGHPQG